jgi:hypothetical protein
MTQPLPSDIHLLTTNKYIMTRKTKKEIIDETAHYYTEDVSRRAIEPGYGGGDKCKYLTSNGKMCAVGRCMVDPSEKMTGTADRYRREEFSGWSTVEDDLRDEYKGHPIEFWSDLQTLHDRGAYWGPHGLYIAGIKYVAKLHDTWDEK